MKFIRLFVRRPVMTSVFILVVFFFGLYSYSRLGVALDPDVDIPVVMIRTAYDGAGPSEIETLISKPIENVLVMVEGVNTIRSVSRQGQSFVMAEFDIGVDIDDALLQVSNRVGQIKKRLPDDADDPVVEKRDINADPFMTIAITSPLPAVEAYDFVDDRIKNPLNQLIGMAQVDMIGGRRREIQVHVDPAKLKHFGLSMTQIESALRGNNFNSPSGHVARGDQETTVRIVGEANDPSDLGELRIPLSGGASIRISDVARVEDTIEEVRSHARYNGREAIFLELTSTPQANIVELSERVREKLDEMQAELPDGMTMTVTNDDSTFVAASIGNVLSNMVAGIVLTGIVLFLFFQRISVTFTIAVAMPVAVVGTLIFFFFAGMTLNMMSTLGLAIAIGMLVNNSILILENIFRHRESGEDGIAAAEAGTAEMALPILASTVTNLGVFLPVVFMGGTFGQFLRDFAVAQIFVTLLSLWVAFTLTPTVAARTSYDSVSRTVKLLTGWWNWLYKLIDRGHHWLVRICLRHAVLTVLFFSMLFAGVLLLAPRIGFGLFPRADSGVVSIEMDMPSSASLAYTSRIAGEVEKFVSKLPHVEDVDVKVSVNSARIRLFLEDSPDRPSSFFFAKKVRSHLAEIPGLKLSIGASTSSGGHGRTKPLRLSVVGPDLDEVNALAETIKSVLAKVEDIVDVDTDWDLGAPELQVKPRRDRLAQNDLNLQDLSNVLWTDITGEKSGTFRSGGREYDILTMIDRDKLPDLFSVAELPISVNGGLVPLRHLADVSFGMGPTEIRRLDRARAVEVSAGLTENARSMGEILTDIEKRIADEVEMPPGYRISYSGEAKLIKSELPYIVTATAMATGLTFFITAAILESYLLAILIMLTIPLAVIGIIPICLLTGTSLSMYGMLGCIMLIGLVVNNAIVILDYAERRRREGLSPEAAVDEACSTKFRAVFMADLTSIIALIPLALGMGEGGVYRAPMAIVTIGGLLAGGTLALFAIPAAYKLVWMARSSRTAMRTREKP